MYHSEIKKHILKFKVPAGTSRGIMYEKPSWFIILYDAENPGLVGLGECGLLPGLSYDDRPGYTEMLGKLTGKMSASQLNSLIRNELAEWPSIRFGLEMAHMDLQNGGEKLFYPGDFTSGKDAIRINGLIWMGDKHQMLQQIEKKLSEGWGCMKLKVGAIRFEEELSLLGFLRNAFTPADLEIRLDANGAFSTVDALTKLEKLAAFEIHSIEQPIKANQWDEMARICSVSPIDIALDEELIGLTDPWKKQEMLNHIRPQYIILKPSLIGGFQIAEEWIKLAVQHQTGWWVTSALESNIGLNAIAQWTYSLKNPMSQGLGTGQLYTNNFDSPLTVKHGLLSFDPQKTWETASLYTNYSYGTGYAE